MAPGRGLRVCARPDCARTAAAALTYDYAASTVWVVELGASHPSSYDLCAWHADRMTVPHGWQLLDSREVEADVVDVVDADVVEIGVFEVGTGEIGGVEVGGVTEQAFEARDIGVDDVEIAASGS